MDTTKFKAVIDYFKNLNIDLPTDVVNAIEDVFKENDNIENIQCYFRNELNDFQHDLRLFNKIKIYTDGKSIGSIANVFTYYGQINFSLSEETTLLNRNKDVEDIIETITNIDNSEVDSLVYDPEEFEVVLFETLTWNTPGTPSRKVELYIFCPENSPEDEYNAEATSD